MTIKDVIYNLPTLPIIMTNSIFTLSFFSVAIFPTSVLPPAEQKYTNPMPIGSTSVPFVHIVAMISVSWH